MITHDCTKYVEVVSYIEKESPTAKSGWFLDRFFRDRRTDAEKLEFRDYSKDDAMPLFYTGVCLPPNLIKPGTARASVLDFSFPVIKAETKVTGCDIEEQSINADGTVIPVGRKRFNNAFKKGMATLFEAQRATHVYEAVTLLRTGGYILHDTESTDVGTVDFARVDELKNIDLTGTQEDWSSMCAKPMKSIKSIVMEMSKHGGISGKIDIIYSPQAWEAMGAHAERDAIKFHTKPNDQFTQELSTYDDVQFMGETEGRFNHWVSTAKTKGYDGNEELVLKPGEIMIASRSGFDGQRVFRTTTSDNKEKLPEGQNVFVYNDLEREYDRKCRSFSPWIEEYHLMVPRNVNGATVVKVVPEDFEACVACEECDGSTNNGLVSYE